MLTNHAIFAEYHYYMKQWFKALMELPRVTDQGLTIPVVYSTPRRAFALGSSEENLGDAGGEPLYAPPNQGNNWLPILTFHMTGMTPVLEKTIPYEHVLTYPIKDNNDNVVGYKKNKPFLVYELTYNATLYTALMQDMDILLFKVATEFRPQAHLWIGPSDAVNDGTKGIWAHVILDSVTDGTEYEPMDIGERVVRKDFTFRITEAYAPTTEPVIDEGIIKEVYGDIYTMPELTLET